MGDRNNEATGVHIFVNRMKVEFDKVEQTGASILETAGFSGEAWDLLKLQGEGDPTGGEPIGAQEVVELKNGEHFRAIPGNRTFGGNGDGGDR